MESVFQTIDKHLKNYSSLLFFELDDQGIIQSSNAFAHKIIGSDLNGKSITSVIVDFTHEFNFESFKQETEKPKLLNINTASGIPQSFHFWLYQTEPAYLLFGEFDNVSFEKLRKELIDLNEELNTATRQLHKSNAELKKLNEQKNEFLGVAAHDLRSPIGVILSYSSFLLEEAENLDEDQQKFLSIIQNSSEFMLKLLNDLLDISKIESGKLELNRSQTDIIKLIQNNIAINRVIADKKEIQILFQPAEEIPLMNLDALKIEQVLNNLLSNAIKYSHPGTTIRLGIFKSNEIVIVSVEDEGQGIPEKEIPNLFKSFGKTSVRTTAGESSTGLGLVITKKILMGHKGKIWVKSTVGKGSTFFFSLPLESK